MARRAKFVLVFLFCFFLILRNAIDCIRAPDPDRIDRDASVYTPSFRRLRVAKPTRIRAKPDEIASLKITYAYAIYARARCLVTPVSVVRNSPFPSATRNVHQNRPNSTSNTSTRSGYCGFGRYRRTDEDFHVFRNNRNVPLGDRRSIENCNKQTKNRNALPSL